MAELVELAYKLAEISRRTHEPGTERALMVLVDQLLTGDGLPARQPAPLTRQTEW
jgi:hypothetical protein